MNDTEQAFLTFQDLLILKQFLEKAYRDNFLNNMEKTATRPLHLKLETIIQEILARHKKETQEQSM